MHSIKERVKEHSSWIERRHLNPPERGVVASVVIPAYKERRIQETLDSLILAAREIKDPIEAIVVLNKGMNNEPYGPLFGMEQFDALVSMDSSHRSFNCRINTLLLGDLPDKYAGVGLSRRIGMDLAALRLGDAKPIFALDADSKVSSNYFRDSLAYFANHQQTELVHFQFSHHESLRTTKIIPPIVYYELHLRYFRHALAWAGHPYSVYTIGSSFAVRSSAYKLTGGMNRRKAGEDFYFIQKYAERKTYTFCPKITVFPSGRSSDRVPFGTGKAVQDIENGGSPNTYHWQSFRLIGEMISNLEHWYHNGPELSALDPTLRQFLQEQRFIDQWNEILQHSSSYPSFRDRFFRWFNAFRAMKCLHYLRDNGFSDQPVVEATHQLCKELGIECSSDPFKQLNAIRQWEEQQT